MGRFILALFCFFVLELVVLIEVGSAIGALSAISLLFLAMLVGATLVKLRCRQVLLAMQEGRDNVSELIFIPLAGFFFIFPGFVSDVLGILLLIPACQVQVLNLLKRSTLFSETTFSRYTSNGSATQTGAGRVIDAEYTEVKEQDRESSQTKL
jgi:UPF0716 protein FxsA